MDSDDECTGPELDPGRSRHTGPTGNIFLSRWHLADRPDEAPAGPPSPQPGRTDVDDTIRLLRNLGALLVFFSAAPTLVAFAGIGMGAPIWFCLTVAFGGGPLTIWAFVMAFAAVRSSLPNGSKDPPSSGEP